MYPNKLFEHESLQSKESIAKYLLELLQGFEKGRISFDSEKGQIEMEPGELLQFNVKAGRKGNNNKISFKIIWQDKIRDEDISISS